ncbi:MAG TPA: YihY/virulence factor BrkB family protein, partial [Actinomycetota bacterium]
MGLFRDLAGVAVVAVAATRVKRLLDSRRERKKQADGPVTNGGGASGDSGTPQSQTSEEIPTQRTGAEGADSPLELPARDWKATAKRTLKEIKDDRITFAAAAMSYYFFLAIFPALIAVVGILGLAEIDAGGLIRSLRETLPGGAGAALTSAVANANKTSEAASLAATVGGIAVALWSASSGLVALQTGLNVAYDVEHDRKFVKKRAIALLLLVAMLLLGGVPSPFFTFGDAVFFTILGWILTVMAVIVLFSIFYYLAPNRESPT